MGQKTTHAPTLTEPMYGRLVHSIAALIFARCVDCGYILFDHFRANRFDVPADILSRLGLMEPVAMNEFGMSGQHIFIDDWPANGILEYVRHAGAPTQFDLLVGLCFLIDWDAPSFKDLLEARDSQTIPLKSFDMTEAGQFHSPDREQFHETAFLGGTAILEELGLGYWTSETGFQLIFPLTGEKPIDLVDTYAETRHNIQKNLGGHRFLYPK